jgi:hypothetical protein
MIIVSIEAMDCPRVVGGCPRLAMPHGWSMPVRCRAPGSTANASSSSARSMRPMKS